MYENENTQEITLLDIVTSLLKKWKAIICVTLAGLLIGSALGLTLTLLGNRFYGARTEFFVSSTATNNYILSMLKSDSYAEALLMDENGIQATCQLEDDDILALRQTDMGLMVCTKDSIFPAVFAGDNE